MSTKLVMWAPSTATWTYERFKRPGDVKAIESITGLSRDAAIEIARTNSIACTPCIASAPTGNPDCFEVLCFYDGQLKSRDIRGAE